MRHRVKKVCNVLSFFVKFYGLGVPNALLNAFWSKISRTKQQDSSLTSRLNLEVLKYANTGAIESFIRPLMARCVCWWYIKQTWGEGAAEKFEFDYVVKEDGLSRLGCLEKAKQFVGKPRTSKSRFLTRPSYHHHDDPIIFYLHGGAFGIGLSRFDYAFMSQVLDPLSEVFPELKALVMDYSCVTVDGENAFPIALMDTITIYREICKAYTNPRIWIISCNAGANLNLGLLQYLAEINDPGLVWPEKSFCISPWLNLSMFNHEEVDLVERTKDDNVMYNFMDRMSSAYLHGQEESSNKVNPYINIEANLNPELWTLILEKSKLHVAVIEGDILQSEIMNFIEQLHIPSTIVNAAYKPNSILKYMWPYEGDWALEDPIGRALVPFFLR
ncbi:steryl deacetylase Ecym_1180 [Eremothecium cymbalariae DBVPG|uniref:Alpha/beta hydrolase fold-3 domain-containing protein n=1 Tax=Eremothecium cymbalariae (strain CBS 270.75 / DBVPG 7215 / KCTC 17166 / NRRL Y-17582) TaxID=931890 RepID=G8JMW6_ERECY|nr:hypothetical protein Ecym_1180 [Eremothecium cymbalariae DBVPG\